MNTEIKEMKTTQGNINQTVLEYYLNFCKRACLEAGKEVLKVYRQQDLLVEQKKDLSPITLADRLSHSIISEVLEGSFPILSEEGAEVDAQARKNWNYFWCIDPLDGTKEFISRNGEFTINIALIFKGTPILGVVYAPVMNKLYWALINKGAFKEENGVIYPLKNTGPTVSLEDPRLKVVCSRSHLNEITSSFVETLNEPELLRMGSSLKFMALAEGSADLYPRFEGSMEWDTAASQIILEEAGGSVINVEDSKPLKYNKESLKNPYFIAISGKYKEL